MHSRHLRWHLPQQVSEDRFLSLLARATRLAELAQQAKPQNRKPVVPQEAAATKAQKQRHGQDAAEKASAKLALKARLGMQVGLPDPQQMPTHLGGGAMCGRWQQRGGHFLIRGPCTGRTLYVDKMLDAHNGLASMTCSQKPGPRTATTIILPCDIAFLTVPQTPLVKSSIASPCCARLLAGDPAADRRRSGSLGWLDCRTLRPAALQNAKLSVSLPASLAVRMSTYRDNEVERIQLGRRCEIWRQVSQGATLVWQHPAQLVLNHGISTTREQAPDLVAINPYTSISCDCQIHTR